MFISLNWIRDFVDLPQSVDPYELGEQFTTTSAEVEGVTRVNIGANGLIAARLLSTSDLTGTRNLRQVVLDVGRGNPVESVTAAPALKVGSTVVYAPEGASVIATGPIRASKVAGKTSAGMILPGEALGIAMALQEALFLDGSVAPGTPLAPDLFDDWLIEIDNKSITHRPDLWGHYGIAREIAAIYGLPLKPYPVVPLEELSQSRLPEVSIHIADGSACRRYSGITLEGVPTVPGPLWMQLRLGRIGMRPISALVDLTNYIMADLGQPMHAFDAARVPQIEVDWAKEGEVFQTLDGVSRKLNPGVLMIQCQGRSIALAGVMGGLDTEVSDATTTLLLESANFDAATIRKAAISLGLRTDASARFEKGLDPTNTVLAIRRFVELARPIYREMRITSRLSDGYPQPQEPVFIQLNPHHVARTIGREVSLDETSKILEPIGFAVSEDADMLRIGVPSFRATNDVTIEEDVIEELARFVGYGTIAPTMPRVTIRDFEPNALHELEQRTLQYFTTAEGFIEIHGYLWYDANWLNRIGFEPGPCVELVNPSAEGFHMFRTTLMPGLLAAVEKNRFHYQAFSVLELGSVFDKAEPQDLEHRSIGLIKARRSKKAEDQLLADLKGGIERWGWRRFGRAVTFHTIEPDQRRPWEHLHRTAAVYLGDRDVGRASVIDLALRRRMEEHLGAWSIAWAEIRLSDLVALPPLTERLGTIPPFPLVDLDFSFVVNKRTRYAEVAGGLARFSHPLLKGISYVGCFEGESLGPDKRSFTFRTILGDDTRTLTEQDAAEFRKSFERHLSSCGYEARG